MAKRLPGEGNKRATARSVSRKEHAPAARRVRKGLNWVAGVKTTVDGRNWLLAIRRYVLRLQFMKLPKFVDAKLVGKVATLGVAVGLAAATGNPIGFLLLSKTVEGAVTTGANSLFEKITDKSPETAKAIAQVQEIEFAKFWDETWGGDTDVDPADLDEANAQLSKHVAACWPTPKVIAAIVADNGDKYPNAIAQHVVVQINKRGDTEGIFSDPKGTPHRFAIAVITTAISAALTQKEYFKTLEPELLITQLGLTVEIKADLEALSGDVQCMGETVSRVEDNQEEMKAMLRELLAENRQRITSDVQVDASIERTILDMVTDKDSEVRAAVKDLLADPPDPMTATSRLKQSLAHDDEIMREVTANRIRKLQQIAAINFYNNGAEAIDALSKLLLLEPNDFEVLNTLGQLYLRMGHPKSAKDTYKSLGKIAQAEEDSYWSAVSSGNLGSVELSLGHLKEASSLFNSALTSFIKQKHLPGIANQHGNLGNIFKQQGDFNDAFTHFEKSLETNRKLGRTDFILKDYVNLGYVQESRGLHKAARHFFNEGLRLCAETNQMHDAGPALSGLGIIALKAQDLPEAEKRFKDALQLYLKLGYMKGIAECYGNLATLSIEKRNLRDAENYIKKSLEIETSIGNKAGMASDHGNLGIVASMQGDFSAGEFYFKEALRIDEEIGDKNGIANCHRNLGDMYFAQKKRTLALIRWTTGYEIYIEIDVQTEADQLREKILGAGGVIPD